HAGAKVRAEAERAAWRAVRRERVQAPVLRAEHEALSRRVAADHVARQCRRPGEIAALRVERHHRLEVGGHEAIRREARGLVEARLGAGTHVELREGVTGIEPPGLAGQLALGEPGAVRVLRARVLDALVEANHSLFAEVELSVLLERVARELTREQPADLVTALHVDGGDVLTLDRKSVV